MVVVAVFVSIGLAWYGYTRFRDQPSDQSEPLLSRRTDRGSADEPAGDPPGSETPGSRDDLVFRLAGDLIAMRVADNWAVLKSKNSAYVVVPFRPSASGALPVGNPAEPHQDSSNPGFVGAAACQACHEAKHSGFVHTSHHQTSAVAVASDLPGPLSPPANELRVGRSNLGVAMLHQKDQPFQRVVFEDWKLDIPMDISIGSGKLGQTYAYWMGDSLYQDHVSYLASTNEWVPSPGFDNRGVVYTRPVQVGCLECHATFIEQLRPPHHYDPQSALWGISCERCHGPAKQHVEYHTANPQQEEAKFIVYPKHLSRERQLDICAQCHSGISERRTAAFAFRPGDRLDDHYVQHDQGPSKPGGIHATNQLARLKQSVCFQSSEMTCTSCHNPHQLERGNRQQFSDRCLDCHEPTNCGMHDQMGERLTSNCIDCHMPTSETQNIQLDTAAGRLSQPMVDHLIRIDQEATDAYLRQ